MKDFKKQIIVIGQLLSCLVIIIISCKSAPDIKQWIPTAADSAREKIIIREAFNQINILSPTLKKGDLITRVGNDYTSQTIRLLNKRDKTFSHIGLVSIENDSIFIYHALGGEWNPDEKIKRDPLYVFADPYNNNAVGIYRLDISEQCKLNIIKMAKEIAHSGVSFDMDFDLKTDQKMYCAEYIAKSLERGCPSIKVTHTFIGAKEGIGIDDIALMKGSTHLRTIRYR